MIKFKNPYFLSPLEITAQEIKTEINDWLKSQPSKKTITLLDIKEALPLLAPKINRRTMNHVAALLAIDIINPEDDEE